MLPKYRISHSQKINSKYHSSWSFRFLRLLNGRMLLRQSSNRQCHSVFLVRTLFSGMNASLSSDGSEVVPISFSESGAWVSIFGRFFGCFWGRENRVLLLVLILVWGGSGSSEVSMSSDSSKFYEKKEKIVDKNCTTVMVSILTSCSDHWTKSYSFGLLANESIISSILISSLFISILTSAAAWFWFISGSTFEHKVFELKKGQFWGSYRFYYQE